MSPGVVVVVVDAGMVVVVGLGFAEGSLLVGVARMTVTIPAATTRAVDPTTSHCLRVREPRMRRIMVGADVPYARGRALEGVQGAH